MRTGAVIVAAGMSSRMGDFKPMLTIGSISIAQRVVATLRQGGAEQIVMVTGYNAIVLERHLAGQGIVYLRNERYETTNMFDSAVIGLEYMKDKVDRVLFTPVDIPLFTAATVSALLSSGEVLAVPVCGGETGHPILISSELIDSILSYRGDEGLRGALEHCGTEAAHVPVEDRGILHDADTPEDYASLLRYHNEQMVRPSVSVSLCREKPFFDNALAMLFSQVEETGSVRRACARVQMSYSSGWNAIRRLESQLNRPLIERHQGGSREQRSRLTEEGKLFLELYKRYSQALSEEANRLFAEYFENFFHSGEGGE